MNRYTLIALTAGLYASARHGLLGKRPINLEPNQRAEIKPGVLYDQVDVLTDSTHIYERNRSLISESHCGCESIYTIRPPILNPKN